jgi:hypothetical protein
MSVATKCGLSLTALGAVVLTARFIPACSSGESAGPPAIDSGTPFTGDGGGLYAGEAGAPCVAGPGQVPNPQCDDGDESLCMPTTCPIDEDASAQMPNGCGSTATCEPLANNTGTTQNFRMRRIILAAPPKLANVTVQNSVVTNGVDMFEPQCGEIGTGAFSWLLSFDTAAHTLKTGGAPPCDLGDVPSCDPFTTGYCFVNKAVPTPAGNVQVGPVGGAYTVATDGTIWTQPGVIPLLNIPIYYQGSIILLPISNGALSGVSITADGNCIGKVNTEALDMSCADNYNNCSKWLTAGALTGFITADRANNVIIKSIHNETLCALLASDPSGQTCQTDADGGVDLTKDPGDYCSNPPGPGGCKDSFWLAATFAASAVTINDGAGTPDCLGGEDAGAPVDSSAPVDSGTPADAGAPADSGGD